MWEISIENQLLTVLISVLFGFSGCALFDVIRATRKSGLKSFWFVFWGDIFFWLFSAFWMFLLLMARTNGEVRLYVLLSALGGFLVFRVTVSPLLLKALTFVFTLILKIFGCFSSKTAVICRKICDTVKIVAVKLKKLLKNSRTLLYNKGNIFRGQG